MPSEDRKIDRRSVLRTTGAAIGGASIVASQQAAADHGGSCCSSCYYVDDYHVDGESNCQYSDSADQAVDTVKFEASVPSGDGKSVEFQYHVDGWERDNPDAKVILDPGERDETILDTTGDYMAEFWGVNGACGDCALAGELHVTELDCNGVIE